MTGALSTALFTAASLFLTGEGARVESMGRMTNVRATWNDDTKALSSRKWSSLEQIFRIDGPDDVAGSFLWEAADDAFGIDLWINRNGTTTIRTSWDKASHQVTMNLLKEFNSFQVEGTHDVLTNYKGSGKNYGMSTQVLRGGYALTEGTDYVMQLSHKGGSDKATYGVNIFPLDGGVEMSTTLTTIDVSPATFEISKVSAGLAYKYIGIECAPTSQMELREPYYLGSMVEDTKTPTVQKVSFVGFDADIDPVADPCKSPHSTTSRGQYFAKINFA